ncbi:MAG: phosphoribosylamine--glycine ligase [Desulfovibrionaceae bacterium]|nr:phosphoribosylamine--glycine ligase [Desulfovibrionaceae bacterium]MBR5734945.1 phosphoribosylamine--glycine ligase [Desulfovibrionaceae bacterium]
MRVLIIGSGGREHALAWKLRQSPRVSEVLIAPGNGGTALEGENVPVDAGDIPALVALARERKVDLVVPGPELPLTLGVVDAMREAGFRCFGPSKWCAQVEGSKAFAKRLMEKAGVPTASCRVFDRQDEAEAWIRQKGAPIVVKADGLAAGKGVIVAKTEGEALEAVADIMGRRAFGEAGAHVVIEDFLEGEEVSLLAFCDGETALPLPSAQDHKAAYDGDTGPNTGGMGAYSPAPVLPDRDLESMTDLVIRPVIREMAREGHPFTGILYAGLMMTKDGPKVLEYNARFGDPECQPLLMRLESDLVDIIEACFDHRLKDTALRISPDSALGVVVAAEGYPGSYPKGMEISGFAEAEANGAKVFQAGTARKDGKIVANGGRVLCVTARGNDLAAAAGNAYAALSHVRMERSRYRSDIGQKGLRRTAGKK